MGSYNFPGTGQEVNRDPAGLNLESRIPDATFRALEAMSHQVESWGLWSYVAGDRTITYRDPVTGFLMAASDPRREMYSFGF